jgi:hypothetical protein
LRRQSNALNRLSKASKTTLQFRVEVVAVKKSCVLKIVVFKKKLLQFEKVVAVKIP